MERELISIIVPVYNGEKVVEKCINSLLKQTYKKIEIILVNDGSSDGTDLICRTYSKKNDCIRYIFQNNQGPGAARNRGIEEAKGKYLSFVDADDYVSPYYLEVLYDNIIKYNVDISTCSYYKIYDGEKKSEFVVDKNVYKVLNRDEALKSLFYRKEMMGYPFLKLFRREMLDNIKFPENIRLGEDFIFIYEIFTKCNRIIYSPNNLYFYCQNSNSITKNLMLKTMQDSWNRLNVIYENSEKFLKKAIISKLFITGIDFYVQLSKENKKSEFVKELFGFIKKFSKVVISDKECKKKDRVIACLGIINIHIMFYFLGICKRLNQRSILRLHKAV